MIKAVTVTNLETRDDLKLTLSDPENSGGFAVLDMSGLGPEQATLNSSEWVTIDGGTIDATHMPVRHITMRLRFLPRTWRESVADIRRSSYYYFPLKKKVRLTFHQKTFYGKERAIYIEGTVIKNSPPVWSKEEGCDIEIACPEPRFQNVEETIISYDQIKGIFHFPFIDHEMIVPTEDDGRLHGFEFPIAEILNFKEKIITNGRLEDGCTDAGCIFEIRAMHGNVKNLYLYNSTTNERMDFEMTLKSGDTMFVDTREGHKNVYKGDGTEEKLIQYMAINSDFIRLIPGNNMVGFGADFGSANVKMQLRFREMYPGI
jgi:hypothetical protein